jgi:hypothetical protein
VTTDELLAEIRVAIGEIKTWKRHHDPGLASRGARAWEGTTREDDNTDAGAGWRITVAAWPAETDMHSAMGGAVITRWGFAGSAVRPPFVIRLTPELAELAATRAKALEKRR